MVLVVLALSLAGTAWLLWSDRSADPFTTSPGGSAPRVSPPPPGAVVVTAAGDICGDTPASCDATAGLVRRLDPDIALTLGDNQYDSGTLAEYLAAYDGAWGAFEEITFPVAGNHEWNTDRAQGYLDYFARDSYWYAHALGAWRFYAIDATCEINGGCAPGDPQYEWLRHELSSHSDRCILAYWHQPRFSSGTTHGSDETLAPIWQLLDEAGADIVLNGHEHNYERFSPQDAQGTGTPQGIVAIVAGTGGMTRGSYPFGEPIANSQVRLNGLGVVELQLWDDGWLERFRRPDGEVVDRTSGTC